MREKFCMRCGTPLNGAAQCPECGYEPQHGEYEVPGGAAPTGQSAPQADNAAVPAPGAAMPPAGAPAVPRPPFAGQGPAFARARHGATVGWPAARPPHGGPGVPYTPPAAPGGQPLYGCRRMPHPAPAGQGGGYAPPYAAWQPGQSPLRWAAPSARCWRALCRSSGGLSCSSGRLNRVQSRTAARWRAAACGEGHRLGACGAAVCAFICVHVQHGGRHAVTRPGAEGLKRAG